MDWVEEGADVAFALFDSDLGIIQGSISETRDAALAFITTVEMRDAVVYMDRMILGKLRVRQVAITVLADDEEGSA